MTATQKKTPIFHLPASILSMALILLFGLSLAASAAAFQDESAAEETATENESEGETAAEEPTTYDNTIRWSTASEVDNFGFDVFRSESADGPFDRLNSKVIEGAGTVDEPQNYQFVDDTIDPYKTYYYYVESISMSGVREKFTPVGRASAKIKTEEEAGEEQKAAAEESDG